MYLDNILARIDSRLDKMAGAGIDVSDVEALKMSADASIETAKEDIADVRARLR